MSIAGDIEKAVLRHWKSSVVDLVGQTNSRVSNWFVPRNISTRENPIARWPSWWMYLNSRFAER
jgi:hypothetical protein